MAVGPKGDEEGEVEYVPAGRDAPESSAVQGGATEWDVPFEGEMPDIIRTRKGAVLNHHLIEGIEEDWADPARCGRWEKLLKENRTNQKAHSHS